MAKRPLFTALALAAGLLSSAAQANTISILGTGFTIDCSPFCQGFVGSPAALSDTQATAYVFSPHNPATETAYLNGLIGEYNLGAGPDLPTVALADTVKTDSPGYGFTTDRLYFSVKKSTWTAFFYNSSGSVLDVAFGPIGASLDDGYSHYTEYGPAVPVPAAVWLFGSGLVGLATLGRRRRATGQDVAQPATTA